MGEMRTGLDRINGASTHSLVIETWLTKKRAWPIHDTMRHTVQTIYCYLTIL